MECRLCGEENEAGAMFCSNCGALLPNENGNKAEACNAKNNRILVLRDVYSGMKYEIKQDGMIARERGDIHPEIFSKDVYISDPHCRIYRVDNQWMVEDMGSLNKTLLNGVELLPFTGTALYEESLLKLADLDFKIEMMLEDKKSKEEVVSDSQSELENGNDQQKNQQKEITVWEITCPCCGKGYEVDGADAIIQSCSYCVDDFDRVEIQYEKAKMRKKYAS